MSTRKELREATALAVNSLSRDQLLKGFAISRVAYLSGLDVIKVPVYSCSRVLSDTIAIHAGKGLTRPASRAGAILEAIEFEVAEHPTGKWVSANSMQLPEEDHLGLEDCFATRSSTVNEFTLLAWEEMTNVQNGSVKLVPSDLIWMVPRIASQPLLYLQMGSNGLASGGSVEDAVLSGLYEVLERDAWTLHQFLLDNCGVLPIRCPLIALPPRLEALVSMIEAANLKLHLFDVTNDYQVPVFSAIILDHTGNVAGTFGGFGCHINAEIAAIRAVTEAIQGRACYISGARDDLFRRQFILMKRMDQVQLHEMFSNLPMGSPLSDYREMVFPDVRSELRYLLKMVRARGVSDVYVKEMGNYVDGTVHVVRVMSPQCEGFRFDHWSPGQRCLSYAKRKLKEMTQAQATVKEEGEEWKQL